MHFFCSSSTWMNIGGIIMKQPRLTKKRREGLRSILAFLSVNNYEESELYQHLGKRHRGEVAAAIEYMEHMSRFHQYDD